jgi:NagD protein
LYFIDVQGTLISDEDKSPIDGAIDFIDRLNSEKISYMVVTNNTKKASQEFCGFLQNSGFNFSYENYLDPLMLVESKVDKSSVAAYGAKEFLDTLEKMDYKFNYKNPKTLLIAIKDDFNSEEFAQMIDFLLGGAKLVGMHETSIYSKNNKRYPGVGAVLKLLEFATSVSYDVVGKPSVAFYEEALKRLRMQNPKADYKSIVMISDDVKGDLGGAKELGMKTVFVTSGKYKSAQEIVPSLKQSLRPDEIYANMAEILKQMK